jgi:hypothetical protein
MSKRQLAILIPLAVLVLLAMVIVPLAIDQPFGAQTPRTLASAFAMRRWSPVVSLLIVALIVTMAVSVWRRTRSVVAKLALVVAVAACLPGIWLARQDPFEWMFNPIPGAHYVSVSDASFVAADDLVLAVSLNGDAAAYPIRQIAYHHVVNDRIGTTPAVVTY